VDRSLLEVSVTDAGLPLALLVRFTLRAGRAHDFDALLTRTIEQIHAKEPGTLIYVCHQVRRKPQERVLYELYRDLQAFEAHEQQGHIQAFLTEREDLVADTVVDRMTPIAAKTPGFANDYTS
jgi:quinol monooxygenase YgiN